MFLAVFPQLWFSSGLQRVCVCAGAAPSLAVCMGSLTCVPEQTWCLHDAGSDVHACAHVCTSVFQEGPEPSLVAHFAASRT